MSSVNVHPSSVFEWLDKIRARPGMYIGTAKRPVREIQTLIHGYYSALRVHGFVEPVPSMDRHFSDWLIHTKDWSTSCGWAAAIEAHSADGDPLSVFFDLVDSYRQLVSTKVATVAVLQHHVPTGRRITIGRTIIVLDGQVARPDRVDVLQYKPEPLHFLRFHYGLRLEDQNILSTSQGHPTTLNDAYDWVRGEFGVTEEDWELVA